jgi:hypothetical protein
MMRFSSFLWCASSAHHATDIEALVEEKQEKPKLRGKPPKYNRENLPSIIVEDPAPWVMNHSKLERQSDGTLFLTSPPHVDPKPATPHDNLAE